MRVLITGFPPFQGRPVNPTQRLVDVIRDGDVMFGNDEVFAEILPCEYAGVEVIFDRLVDQIQPHVVLSFGVGRHAETLRLESSGVNFDDARIPDNSGELRTGSPICDGGPDVLRPKFDLSSLCSTLLSQNIPTEVSDNAGRFVCNHLLYYGTLTALESEPQFQFLFTHVPTEEQGFQLERTLNAVEVMLEWFRRQISV